jgi:hypothetical protein
MPQTETIFYQDAKGRVPLITWLDGLRAKVVDKGIARITLLAKQGNELRFPNCKNIDGDIWALRFKWGKVNHRILYAFCGQNVILLTNGTTKEKHIPNVEIERDKRYLANYRRNPERHTHSGGPMK